MRHSDKPRTDSSKIDEVLDRMIRLETRLCILMTHLEVQFESRVAPMQHHKEIFHGQAKDS